MDFVFLEERASLKVGGLEMPALGSGSVERGSFVSYRHLRFEGMAAKCLLCLLGFSGRWCGQLPWSVNWY